MYFAFLMEVVKRAFSPAARVTDVLQILAASALPATSFVAGLKLPSGTQDGVLAYIGLIALSYIGIRLFWAPYSMWKDQGALISDMASELSRPEQKVMERLAKHRAKARTKLAAKLEDFQLSSYYDAVTPLEKAVMANKMAVVRKLQAKAGLSQAFEQGRNRLQVIVMNEAETPNSELALERRSDFVMKLLQRHLFGELNAEELLLALPNNLSADRV